MEVSVRLPVVTKIYQSRTIDGVLEHDLSGGDEDRLREQVRLNVALSLFGWYLFRASDGGSEVRRQAGAACRVEAF